MSAARIGSTWRQIDSIKVKKNGTWVEHASIYGRSESSWREVDLNAEQQDPAFHVWKAYADDELGNGISLVPNTKHYIGFATGQTSSDINLSDPSIFDWSLIKGETGVGTVDEILDVTGWEELPTSGADVTDYETISEDIASSIVPVSEALEATQVSLEEANQLINSVKLDEASVVALNDTFQQLGLDLLAFEGDKNAAFTTLLDKMADTDQFVAEINDELGQVLVEGTRVSYDTFIGYQLLVDTLNASLTSVINQVTNTDLGLSAAHSKIDQNLDKITILSGVTDFANTVSRITQVSLTLDRLANAVTQQSVAFKSGDWSQLQSTLNTELTLTELTTKNIDFAFAQEELTSNIDEVAAEASSTKILAAKIDSSLSNYVTSEVVKSTVDSAKAEVTNSLRADITYNDNKLTSQLATLNQTVSTNDSTTAQSIESLNSTLENGLATANSEITATKKTVSDESQARASAVSNLTSTFNNLENGLSTANSEITATKKTISDESQARASAVSNLTSTFNNLENGLATANSEITATKETLSTKATSSALSALSTRVTSEEENSAAATLTMTAQRDAIEGLSAQVFLGVDINGRVTGIYMAGDTDQSIIDIAGDKIQFTNPKTGAVDFRWSAVQSSFIFRGSINLIGDSHMRLSSGKAFGSSNQFIEWFGLVYLDSNNEPDFSKIKESNAISYLKSDGSAYFGGAIVSGTLSTSEANSSLSVTSEVDIGDFGSNGGSIAINCSVTLSSSIDVLSSTQPTAPSDPKVSFTLEEYISGSWTNRKTVNATGEGRIGNVEFEPELGKWTGVRSQNLVSSFTYTDSRNSTANRRYRLRMISRTGLVTTASWNPKQRLSLTTSEG